MTLMTFEPGNTIQFTFVSSVAPNAAPNFAVRDKANTVIHSGTSATSDTTHFYALYTIPDGNEWYSGEWLAQKTVSGSVYDFIRRFGFRALETIAEN